jgi:hypothetical protein
VRGSLLFLILLTATGAEFRPLVSPDPPGGGFGDALTAIPDVNGDGRVDILLGAYVADTSVSESGRAYLFSGLDGAFLRVLDSAQPISYGLFGLHVGGLHDIDGDEFGDAVVTADQETVGSYTYAGRVYVFSGRTGAVLYTVNAPDPSTSFHFGAALAVLGDVDNDGKDDFAVGAGLKFYIVSGAAGTIIREVSQKTYTLAMIPDVDADGRSDIAVGVYKADGAVPRAGRAYIYSSGTGQLLRTLASPHEQTDGDFGYSVAGLPDLNGDGAGELLVGGDSETVAGQQWAGRAYLFSGGNGQVIAEFSSPQPQYNAHFGSVLAGLPDVSGDGKTDFAISSIQENVGAYSAAGRVYVYSGASFSLYERLSPSHPETENRLGDSLAGLPFSNPSGPGDLLARTYARSDPSIGFVYLVGHFDSDGDGIADGRDNCPAVSNPSQQDSDADGIGDACDACPQDPANDADKDGICAPMDNCPLARNPDQTDSDADGIGDVCDNCPMVSNADQMDSDADGLGDACDQCDDSPPGAYVSRITGCTTPRADFDRDGDVDQSDFSHLQICMTGANVFITDLACRNADLDSLPENDVDQSDLARFLSCFAGPDVSATPACVQ